MRRKPFGSLGTNCSRTTTRTETRSKKLSPDKGLFFCPKIGETMARTRASAKKAGSTFERSLADWLARHVDDRIDRRVKNGAKDRGDIGGLRHMGGRVVIEAKDYGGRLLPGPWLNEAETERGNDDALCGLVIAKRRG